MAADAPNVAARHAGGPNWASPNETAEPRRTAKAAIPHSRSPGMRCPGPLLPAEVLAEPEGQDGDQERQLERQDGLHDGETAHVEGEGLQEESGDEAETTQQPHLPPDGVGDQAPVQRRLRRCVLDAHALEDGRERVGQGAGDGEHVDHVAHLPVGRPRL
jgi:hypothetical protein